MDIASLFISGLFLFGIIFLSVRLAIAPLIPDDILEVHNLNDVGIVKLRDIGIFNNEELEEVIKIYKGKGTNKRTSIECQKFTKVMLELKNLGYLTEEEFEVKSELLNTYYDHN